MRDKTRDELYITMREMGIDASMVKRGRPEERIGGWFSKGIIEIRNNPIRWINIHKRSQGPGYTYYVMRYGVPDTRLGPEYSKLKIKSVIKKTFLSGRKVDLNWKGSDLRLGIISRLNSDISVNKLIMESIYKHVVIEVNSEHKCWVISEEPGSFPSRELWNCYQTIACHLLAEWSSTE